MYDWWQVVVETCKYTAFQRCHHLLDSCILLVAEGVVPPEDAEDGIPLSLCQMIHIQPFQAAKTANAASQRHLGCATVSPKILPTTRANPATEKQSEPNVMFGFTVCFEDMHISLSFQSPSEALEHVFAIHAKGVATTYTTHTRSFYIHAVDPHTYKIRFNTLLERWSVEAVITAGDLCWSAHLSPKTRYFKRSETFSTKVITAQSKEQPQVKWPHT